MPKVKQYKQNFCSEWLKISEFRSWLKEVENDSTKAQCSVCHTKINAKYYDLVNHMRSKKHVEASQSPLPDLTKFIKQWSGGTSCLESKLALFLACHSAIMNCDHLTDMLKNTVTDSNIASQLKMHRTKWSEIIKKKFGSSFRNWFGEWYRWEQV